MDCGNGSVPELVLRQVHKLREEGKEKLLVLFGKMAVEAGYPEVKQQIDGQAW